MNRSRSVFIQLCALNERDSIGDVICRIPRHMHGVEAVRVLVVDDGSTDDTSDVARAAGADIVIRHVRNAGLGQAFGCALSECLARDADVIVHLDADGQHRPEDIPALLAPILAGTADLAVGNRRLAQAEGMSVVKRWVERMGSGVVRLLTGTPVRDAVCGFRAYSHVAAAQLHITQSFSYTLETLVQAGAIKLRIANVPITSQRATRQSRLCASSLRFVCKQTYILLRSLCAWHLPGLRAQINEQKLSTR